jgi:hypothetical protein
MVVMVITQIENRRRVENLRSLYSTVLFAVTILLSTFVSMGYHYIHHANATTTTDDTTDTDLSYEAEANDQPIITDPNLEVKQVVEGLELPTTMAFLVGPK